MVVYRLERIYKSASAPPIPVLQYDDEHTDDRLLLWPSPDELSTRERVMTITVFLLMD